MEDCLVDFKIFQMAVVATTNSTSVVGTTELNEFRF